MKKLTYLIRKEFIQFRRSRSMMAISVVMPIIQLLVMGFAISVDVEHVPTAVTDLDNTQTSRALTGKLEDTRYMDVTHHPTDIRDGGELLMRGDVIISLVIPVGFERDIRRGEHPALLLDADAQNTNVALTGAGYVRRIVQSWASSGDLPVPRVSRPGLHAVSPASRIRYNPDMKAVFYMVPGIVVLLVTIITMLLTALAIVREREAGTLEQLIVTPINRVEMILGKTIPFAILGMFELCISMLVAMAVYDIRIAGSIPLFIGISVLYMFCSLGAGILISTIAHTQQQALFIAWFTLVSFILMGGFFLSLEMMPLPAYVLTYLNPLRYFMTIIREIFLKGSGLDVLLPDIVAVAIIAVIVNTAAIIRFNKRLG